MQYVPWVGGSGARTTGGYEARTSSGFNLLPIVALSFLIYPSMLPDPISARRSPSPLCTVVRLRLGNLHTVFNYEYRDQCPVCSGFCRSISAEIHQQSPFQVISNYERHPPEFGPIGTLRCLSYLCLPPSTHVQAA